MLAPGDYVMGVALREMRLEYNVPLLKNETGVYKSPS